MQKQQTIMYFRVLVVISLLKLSECQYGTAELIKFSVPRRSRLLSDFTETQTPPPNYDESVQARSLPITEKSIDQQLDSTPSSTVDELNDEPVPTADTLRKYARIFKMDTENLNEQQRMLLTKIVQRIARLNGANSDEQSIDLNGNEGRARHRNRDERKKSQKKPHPAQTNGDLVPNSSSSTSEPTRSTTVATKSKTNQQSAAQKKKVAASNSHNHIAIETTLPFSVTVTEPTVPASKSGKMRVTQANDATLSNASSVDLGNITTTSIVNILSTDNARENLYIRRPSPATIAAIHDKLPSHHKVSNFISLYIIFIFLSKILKNNNSDKLAFKGLFHSRFSACSRLFRSTNFRSVLALKIIIILFSSRTWHKSIAFFIVFCSSLPSIR